MVKALDTRVATAGDRPAVLDTAHLGDIQGTLGAVRRHDIAPRRSCQHRRGRAISSLR